MDWGESGVFRRAAQGEAHMRMLIGIATVALAAGVTAGQPYCVTSEILGQTIAGPTRVIGDFNHDGLADIAASIDGVNGLLVRLANANGAFDPPTLYKVPSKELVVVDIDDDGDEDLIAIDPLATNTFTTLLNTHSTFLTVLDSVETGSGSVLFAVADITGDGLPDVVVARNIPEEGYWLYANQGNGDFAEPTLALSGVENEIKLKPFDLDGDGDEDLIALGIGFQTTVQYLESVGSSIIRHPYLTTASLAVDVTDFEADVGDLNGDDFVDIAVAYRLRESPSSYKLQFVVYMSDATGNLIQSEPLFDLFPSGFPSATFVVDFNRDSFNDVVVARSGDGITPNLLLFLGTGDGAFNQRALDLVALGDFAGGDIDDDGDMDLIGRAQGGSGSNSLVLLRNRLGDCTADLNLDCSVDFADVVAFLSAFGASAGDADFAAPFGQWDFSDVIAFLTVFVGGCP